MMKLRSRLYKKCGVVLDDAGNVAEDKAVQADVAGETFYFIFNIMHNKCKDIIAQLVKSMSWVQVLLI